MTTKSERDFFLLPSCPSHRQYEALRAVFVDGSSQKAVAEKFGYQYGAFRQVVLEFREALNNSQTPFLFRTHLAGPATPTTRNTRCLMRRVRCPLPSPMSGSST